MVRTDLYGTTADTLLALATSCAAGPALSCDDDPMPDPAPTTYGPSRLVYPVNAGQPLEISVAGFMMPPVDYTLAVQVLPARSVGQSCDPTYQLDACTSAMGCSLFGICM